MVHTRMCMFAQFHVHPVARILSRSTTDRAYVDFAWLQTVNHPGTFFVARINKQSRGPAYFPILELTKSFSGQTILKIASYLSTWTGVELG
jgi:hypothetical protein